MDSMTPPWAETNAKSTNHTSIVVGSGYIAALTVFFFLRYDKYRDPVKREIQQLRSILEAAQAKVHFMTDIK